MEHQRADNISPLDMFKIGIGPSSSHTMGPMVAALEFRKQCIELAETDSPLRFEVALYGSLSATGRGHAYRWCYLRRIKRNASQRKYTGRNMAGKS